MMQASQRLHRFSLQLIRQRRTSASFNSKMFRYSTKAAFFVLVGCLWSGSALLGTAKRRSLSASVHLFYPRESSSVGGARALQGEYCRTQACDDRPSPLLRLEDKPACVGVRCSLALDDRDSTVDFIRLLSKQFGQVTPMFFLCIVHAYSDLSTRAAQDLGRTAPQSLAAHKLNAEALEMQGKWQPAQLEYEGMIEKNPNTRGLHFLLGRLLLSRPDAGPEAAYRAKQEFLKELQLDPNNAAAHDILGELARRDEQWDEAISRFSRRLSSIPILQKLIWVGAIVWSRLSVMKKPCHLCATRSDSRPETPLFTTP